jgi:hypothetical protein
MDPKSGAPESYTVRDGLDEICGELGLVVRMIADTAKWVHPDTFMALPIWYPETARGRPSYDASWTRVYENKVKATGLVERKTELNTKAATAFRRALGVAKPLNWTVCHISAIRAFIPASPTWSGSRRR